LPNGSVSGLLLTSSICASAHGTTVLVISAGIIRKSGLPPGTMNWRTARKLTAEASGSGCSTGAVSVSDTRPLPASGIAARAAVTMASRRVSTGVGSPVTCRCTGGSEAAGACAIPSRGKGRPRTSVAAVAAAISAANPLLIDGSVCKRNNERGALM